MLWNCSVTWILGLLAKALLLFYYGFLDIGRNGMVQRMKYCAHFGDDAGDIHYGRDPLAAMLNCFPNELQFDAELAKMSCLSGSVRTNKVSIPLIRASSVVPR